MSIFEDRKYLQLSNINYSYKNKKQQIILINSYLEMFYFIMCTLIVKYSVKSCYCCLFYVLAFQDQHTLPKWNILWKAVIVACSMYWPFRTSTPSQSEIFCLKALIVDLREYFTLGGCAGPERPIHRTSNNNSFETEYFTLGGCAGPERPIHRTSNNNSFETEYFTLGGCAGPQRG